MSIKDKILICPDSFKGTISATDVAETINNAIKSIYPDMQTILLPIADGGEGTLSCFWRALSGRIINIQTRNSNFKTINAPYLLSSDKAIIESAKVIGLAETDNKDPSKTTSYGVGILIKDALRHTKNIVLTLGGTSTNDGGAGILAALGVKFIRQNGENFIPTGGTLKDIAKIDTSDMIKDINMTCMCDVENLLYGEKGASYVFAPQKGADYMMVKDLDLGLRHFAEVIQSDLGINVSNIKGAGAAGGIPAGMVAFFNAKLMSGIDIMLDSVGFDDLLDDAKIVVTGEGKLDSQSLGGKAISGIVNRSSKKNVPVIAICGQIELGFDLKASGLALATATSGNIPLSPSRNYKQELFDASIKLFGTLLKNGN